MARGFDSATVKCESATVRRESATVRRGSATAREQSHRLSARAWHPLALDLRTLTV